MNNDARLKETISSYDLENISIATVCSHSSLQIFHGAKKEGFHTIGIAVGEKPRFYDAFPAACPDEFLIVESYKDIVSEGVVKKLLEKNAIVVPHGSFVEYLGAENFLSFKVPSFGNKHSLTFESDRKKERKWLEGAGVPIPRIYDTPEEIDGPVIVKFDGAKGGKGFFVTETAEEFYQKIKEHKNCTIQEFILGARYYLHFFYSPVKSTGYQLKKGSLELLGMDRRIETNIDELFRMRILREGSLGHSKNSIQPSFVVTGNAPIIARESLLPKVFELGEKVVEESVNIFGGLTGPFCLETICTDNLEFKVFEISARIVAGTNLFPSGSPYSDFIEPDLSTGRRIAEEIRLAVKSNKLDEIIS
ncbi:MAG: formate--phosphoribosylaminoimidazolecarboxamide ligase [Candidatus Diapherotrites archaeon]|nr:formate--phosphoribosylaminoimidazolecarboxamide ligase [Candidatus Diapherotrites archaeon]